MGIDPGSQRTGWGVVRHEGSRLQLVDVGILIPPPGADLSKRLADLHAGLADLLSRHSPDLIAIESIFHGPNTKSLVVLGQARGALLAAVGESGRHFVDLSPAEVKKAVTGRGGAAKDRVAHMVGVMLGPTLAEHLKSLGIRSAAGCLDATDALAVAIAAIHRERFDQKLGQALGTGRTSRRGAGRGKIKSRWKPARG